MQSDDYLFRKYKKKYCLKHCCVILTEIKTSLVLEGLIPDVKMESVDHICSVETIHNEEHHETHLDESQDNTIPNKSNNKCKTIACNTRKKQPESLKNQFRRVQFKPKFKCCRKTFIKRKNLFLHMKQRLTKTNPCTPVYACKVCSTEFKLYLDLYHHSKNLHPNLILPQPNYLCGRCFRSYRAFYFLQRHQMNANDCLPVVDHYFRINGLSDLKTEFENYCFFKTSDDTVDNLNLVIVPNNFPEPCITKNVVALPKNERIHEQIDAAIRSALTNKKPSTITSSNLQDFSEEKQLSKNTLENQSELTNSQSTSIQKISENQDLNIAYKDSVLEESSSQHQKQILSKREKFLYKYNLRIKLNTPKRFLPPIEEDAKRKTKRQSKLASRNNTIKQMKTLSKDRITLKSLLDTSYNPFIEHLKTNNTSKTSFSSNEVIDITSDNEEDNYLKKYNVCKKLVDLNVPSSSLIQLPKRIQQAMLPIHECSECGKKFKKFSSLEHHKVINHCKYCKYATCLSSNLINHYSVKHNIKYFCNFCTMSFTTESIFENHNKSHVCPNCNEMFANVMQHLETCKKFEVLEINYF